MHRLPGLGHRPAYAAATSALMAVWWFTEALPMAWTACLPLLLHPLFGLYGQGLAGDAARAAAPYVDPYIFLFLGGMAIGAAMEAWNLHRRVALHILAAVGTEPRRLLLGVLVSTALISSWISNTASAVMMMPIGMALIAQLEASAGRSLRRFGCAIMLAVAYAANVGGIGTKIGTATNSIFAGFVSDKLGRDLSFLEYLGIGLPFVALFLPIIWMVLWREARRDELSAAEGRGVVERELAALGPMSGKEKLVAATFVMAAGLWMASDPVRQAIAPGWRALWPSVRFQGKHYEAGVAMLAALVLLAAGALPRRALRRIPVATLLLLGGSFAMAGGIEGSGLSSWMTTRLAQLATLPLLAQLGLASLATVFLSAVASNTATVNLMLNVLPRSLPVLSATAIASSCDFALPAGTPPNAIVFGSGYIRLPQMMRIGFLLDLMAAAAVTLYAWLYLTRVL